MLLAQVIILQIIVFGAVIFILKKILYQDTESSINRLDRVYQDLLNKQKDLTQKIEQAEKEYNVKKEEANLITSKMKTEAMDEIWQKQDEVIKKAKSEAEEIIKKAHESEEKFLKELEKGFGKKVIEYAAGLVKNAFGPKTLEALHHAMVTEFLEKAKEVDLTQVAGNIDTLVIKSAFGLSKGEVEQFQAFISSKLNRAIKIETVEDKNLIAGVILQFGSLLLDGSLTNHVREASELAKKNLALES